MAQQGDDADLGESSSEDEEFTGRWDDHCKLVAYDMQTKKSLADQFASERITELLKKNNKCKSDLALLSLVTSDR
jgi:hypothetical protein